MRNYVQFGKHPRMYTVVIICHYSNSILTLFYNIIHSRLDNIISWKPLCIGNELTINCVWEGDSPHVWFYIYKFISTLFRRFTSVHQLRRSPNNIVFFTLGFAWDCFPILSFPTRSPPCHFRRPGPSECSELFRACSRPR